MDDIKVDDIALAAPGLPAQNLPTQNMSAPNMPTLNLPAQELPVGEVPQRRFTDRQGAGAPPAAMGLTSDDIRIARVVSVSGTRMSGLLDRPGDPAAWSTPQFGDVVKMVMPKATVFALVTGLSIALPRHAGADPEAQIIELELFGEIERVEGVKKSFQRGISTYPSLDHAIYQASAADLHSVFIRPELNGVRIGTFHQNSALPAYIVPNDLLGKHFAVLGTTGSGKSCAVAVILRAILAHHQHAHIVIIDPHNEYGAAFGDVAEVIRHDSLELPYWLLNAEELAELIIGSDARDAIADRAILNLLIAKARRDWPQNAKHQVQITVDTPVPFRLSDVFRSIDEALGKLEKPADMAAYLRIRDRLQALQADRRYSFMFPGVIVKDNMAAILARLFRIPINGKPLSILDISSLPSEILNVVASLLFRMAFDFALWNDGSVPVLLVCEEAHRYAPNDGQTLFEPTKRGLMRIAKEGRKYGVSLCLVSQRPSELATTILSQCSTIFALRMSSQKDQNFLAAALPESSIGLMGELPALRGGEAIALGEGVPVSARIRFDRLAPEHQPQSQSAPFAHAWNQDLAADEFVQEAVAHWRRQR
jgi:hypothetical protein